MDLVGKTIINKYHIVEKIAEGGMSTVYGADGMHEYAGRRFAIKVLRGDSVSHRIEDIIRFKNEAITASRLDHPNIARVIEIIELDHRVFIIMERIDGNSLRELMAGMEKPLPLAEAVDIVSQVCRALVQVHDAGIIHRDIKSGNIIISTNEPSVSDHQYRATVIDFGLAAIKDFSDCTEAGDRMRVKPLSESIAGTFGYIAPELIMGSRNGPDERSDLYSLGVVFYELVTGRLPFDDNDLTGLLHAHLAQTPRSPLSFGGNLPPAVGKVIEKLLCKDPARRYQCARGILADLEKIARGVDDFTPGRDDRPGRLSFRTPLIGRDAELARLIQAFDRARSGQGCLCLVNGDSGMGKTRLVEELMRHAYRYRYAAISGACFSTESKTPYGPFSDALDQYLRRFHAYEPARRKAIKHKISKIVGAFGEIPLRLNPMLSVLIDTPKPLVPLDPDREKNRFLLTLAGFFHGLARIENGLLLLLEDLHWADEATVSLLEQLLHNLADLPLLIVGTCRSSELGYGHGLSRLLRFGHERSYPLTLIDLAPFPSGDMGEYASRIFRRDIDDPAIREIAACAQERSRGNPFFAREIFKQLIDDRAVEYDADNRLRINPALFKSVDIPDTIVDILLRRITLFDADEKRILSYAAVIGRKFALPFLLEILEAGEADSPGAEEDVLIIDRAIALGLLENIQSEPHTLAFSHETIRAACYDGLEPSDRVRIHGIIAIALERQNLPALAGDPGAVPAIFDLARHSISAIDRERSIRYALPAGRRAWEKHAYEDALYYLSWALVFTQTGSVPGQGFEDVGTWCSVNRMIGDIYLIINKNNEAIRIFNSLLLFVASPYEKSLVYQQISKAYFKKGDWKNCEEFGRIGLALLGERLPTGRGGVLASMVTQLLLHRLWRLPAPRALAPRNTVRSEVDAMIIWFYYALGWSYVLNDSLKFARTILRMLTIAGRRLPESREMAMSLAGYGTLCAVTNRFALSIRCHEQSLRLRERLNDAWGIAQSYQLTGFAYYFNAELTAALDCYRESIRRFEAIGDQKEVGNSLQGLIWSYLILGAYSGEKEAIDRYYEIAVATGDALGICYACFYYGGYYRDTGDMLVAMEYFSRAHAMSVDRELWVITCLATVAIAGMYLVHGDIDRAVGSYEEARRMSVDHRLINETIAHLYHELAEAYIAEYQAKPQMSRRERTQALKRISQACAVATRKTRRSVLIHGGALRAMAKYYALCGKSRLSVEYFERSLAHLRKINFKCDIAKTLYDYGIFLHETGDHQKGLALISESYSLFKAIGNRTYIQKPRDFLGVGDDAVPTPVQQLYRRLKEKKKIESIFELIREISANHEADAILEKALAMVMEISGAGRGCIVLRDDDGQERVMAAKRLNPSETEHYSNTIINRTFALGEPMLSTNAEEDGKFSAAQSVAFEELRSVLSVPIRYKDRVIGVCYLDNTLSNGVFTAEDIEHVGIIMDQISVSIGLGMMQRNVDRLLEFEPDEAFYARFGITRREREIILLLLKGNSHREIAVALDISESTVKNHLNNIYTKTGVQGRMKLIELVKSASYKPFL